MANFTVRFFVSRARARTREGTTFPFSK